MMVAGTALGEAASYNYGYNSFDTGTGSSGYWSYTGTSNTAWNGSWGWYKPLPTKPSTPTTPTTPNPNPGTPGGGTTDPVTPPTTTQPPAAGLSAEENEAINLVNAARAANGLAPLKVNMDLVRLARMKAKDMADKAYFDHISPTYGSPFDMMKAAGILYRTAGENIARASSVSIAHNAFMDSPGHRANILNSAYTEIGIGIYRSGKTMWESQFFMKPR